MNKYSKNSRSRLDTCHPDIQRLMEKVLETYDHSILCGYRGKEEQDYAYLTRKSKLKFPRSKHNKAPSIAVDIQPYPYKDERDLHHFIGYVQAVADSMGIKIRCGRDWNMNHRADDETFMDAFHIELVN